MKRYHPDELPTDTEQRHLDAVANAERLVVCAAERWADAPTGTPFDGRCVAALERSVERLRAARKAKAPR